MNPEGQIPRSRGGICGVLLILLGLWGALAPFVGPYLHFGYNPDIAWKYTSGRLYYSAIPGAAALLGGMLVLITRNRAVGIIGGLLAALGGAWFWLGDGVMTTVLKKTSVSIGTPLTVGSGFLGSLQQREYFESIALFGGVGLLILFFGALATGRFSMLAAKDVAVYDPADSYYPAAGTASQTDLGGYPSAAGSYQPSVDLYPTNTGPVPTAHGPSPFADSPPPAFTRPPFADSPSAFPDTTTNQFLPPETTA